MCLAFGGWDSGVGESLRDSRVGCHVLAGGWDSGGGIRGWGAGVIA